MEIVCTNINLNCHIELKKELNKKFHELGPVFVNVILYRTVTFITYLWLQICTLSFLLNQGYFEIQQRIKSQYIYIKKSTCTWTSSGEYLVKIFCPKATNWIQIIHRNGKSYSMCMIHKQDKDVLPYALHTVWAQYISGEMKDDRSCPWCTTLVRRYTESLCGRRRSRLCVDPVWTGTPVWKTSHQTSHDLW